MRVYHFTKDIRKGFAKFYQLINSSSTIICFDFEDSICAEDDLDPFEVRNEHRTKILNKLIEWDSQIGLSEFGFRINKFYSSNYNEDIKALSLQNGVHSIFVPKVESRKELVSIIEDITFHVQEIIPIIETKIGFDNANEIVSIKDPRFKRIAFGHCDYNLSLGNFPFFHHETKEYWDWISKLNGICKKNNIEIINSPVLELENTGLMQYSKKMCGRFSQVTGHISLCKKHTDILGSESVYNNDFSASFLDAISNDFQSAKSILSIFENYEIKNKSFALTAYRRIISPQEKIMATIKIK